MFRGEQYARAIGLFQRKNGPGTLPPSFDVLVEQKFLRKKFKDPITDDEFVPVALAAGAPTAGQVTPPGGSPPAGSPPAAAPRSRAGRRRLRRRPPPGARGGTPGAANGRGHLGCDQQEQGKLHSSLQRAEPLQRVDVHLHAAGSGGGRGRRAGNGGAGSRWTRPSWRSGCSWRSRRSRPSRWSRSSRPVQAARAFPSGPAAPNPPNPTGASVLTGDATAVKTLWSGYQLSQLSAGS